MLWQLPFHSIDPVFLRLGPIELRWYGLMYMIGFIAAYFVMRRMIKHRGLAISQDDLYDFLFYLILGLMIGGRLGYVLIYDLGTYLENPLSSAAIWRGGMSFHGGLVGMLLAAILFTRRREWNFLEAADLIAVAVPIGLGLGRIGNFINGELYGRPSDLPWAMVFPAGGVVSRHPSQLYEAFLEGLLLFLVVRWIYLRGFRAGAAAWVMISTYGLFRFSVEFVREPDAHIGFDVAGVLTRGQVLSLPMILVGSFLLLRTLRRAPGPSEARSGRPPRRHAKKKSRGR